jgi:hypothetical protein
LQVDLNLLYIYKRSQISYTAFKADPAEEGTQKITSIPTPVGGKVSQSPANGRLMIKSYLFS